MSRPTQGEMIVSSTNGVEKMNIHMQKSEVGLLFYSVHKNYQKGIKTLKIRPKIYKIPRRKQGENFMTLDLTMNYCI